MDLPAPLGTSSDNASALSAQVSAEQGDINDRCIGVDQLGTTEADPPADPDDRHASLNEFSFAGLPSGGIADHGINGAHGECGRYPSHGLAFTTNLSGRGGARRKPGQWEHKTQRGHGHRPAVRR